MQLCNDKHEEVAFEGNLRQCPICAVIEGMKERYEKDRECEIMDKAVSIEKLLSLRNEINCRIEHGAEGTVHLRHTEKELSKIINFIRGEE